MSGVNCTRRKLEPERLRERVDGERLGHAGRPLEQDVPAGAGRDQREVDRLLLPDDDAPHLGAHPLEGLDHALSPPLVDACQAARGRKRGRAAWTRRARSPRLVLAQPGAARGREQLVVAARPGATSSSRAPPPRPARSPPPGGPARTSAPASPSA